MEVEIGRVEEERKEKRVGKEVDDGERLVDDFLRLHMLCYRGERSEEHDELEGRVCVFLAEGVQGKGAIAQDWAQKTVLSSIAAEYVAGVRLRGKFYGPPPFESGRPQT